MESILQIQEKYEEDDSIKSYEYNEYYPSSGSNLNMAGQITITIENLDEFYHPRRSWLLVEGDLLKAADGTRYGDDDLITLTNNAIMYLFTNIKYELSGQEIESLNHPGFATTMLGLAKRPFDYAKGSGLMQCWYPDTSTAAETTNVGFEARRNYVIKTPTPKGSFSFGIELENMFGFCEDYDKVVYGMRHSLILIRKSDDDAIFRAAAPDAGKVKLSKISWMMPRVHPSDAKKYNLYKSIESKVVLDAAYRMRQCNIIEIPANTTAEIWRLGVRTAPEKPRYILIGIQQDKSGNQEKNASLFDHANVTKMSIVMNDTEYPALDINNNFTTNQYVHFYKMMVDFSRDFYGIDPLVGGSGAITPLTYKELFPLFVFNVSKQSERINQSVVDVTVKMQFSQNVGAHARAYALVISDRRLKFQSDGRKMNVVY